MLIAVPGKRGSVFSSRRWQPRPEHILITERAGLVERQRGAGLVSSNRRMQRQHRSVVPSHATSLRVAVSSISGVHCRRFRTQSAGRGCGMSRVTVAQRLVMGKGFFARHKHPLHWCVQQIVNGIRCRVTCSQRCRCPLHQTIQRSITARLCTLWCCGQNARAVSTVIPGVSASTRACSSRP